MSWMERRLALPAGRFAAPASVCRTGLHAAFASADGARMAPPQDALYFGAARCASGPHPHPGQRPLHHLDQILATNP